MPFDATTIIAIVAFCLAIAVWVKTRALGKVVGVLIGAFVVMAITDRSVLTDGGALVGDAISWAFDTIFTFGE